jgi:UDP-GlcNAc3NAcA epimerase
MKIITIIGARPQFIKTAAVSSAFAKSKNITEIIVHTGQHFDSSMSDIFFEELQIPAPKYNLAINSLSHGAMTGRMIEEIEKVLILEKPDYVLLYGDTNSTIAGSLAAKKMHIKVIHIEAGLRSFNMAMPEEINRIVTDRLSDILFCPTEKAVQNLLIEGFDSFDCRYYYVGDVMYDAVCHFLPIAKIKSSIKNQIGLNNYISCTLHRQETTDNEKNFRDVIDALNTIHKQIPVVLPIHPRTKKMLEIYNIRTEFKIIDPLGYLDMLEFVSNSMLTITDSGGLQKESYFLKKCCAVVRNDTEWLELVDNGYAQLTGYNRNNIINIVTDLLNKKMNFGEKFYGDGHASELITNKLLGLKCELLN